MMYFLQLFNGYVYLSFTKVYLNKKEPQKLHKSL